MSITAGNPCDTMNYVCGSRRLQPAFNIPLVTALAPKSKIQELTGTIAERANKEIESRIRREEYIRIGVNKDDFYIEVGRGIKKFLPSGIAGRIRRRMLAIKKHLGNDWQRLAGAQIYLVPPEYSNYPYYVYCDFAEGRVSGYAAAHAGSDIDEVRNVFMTYRTFLERPAHRVAKIIRAMQMPKSRGPTELLIPHRYKWGYTLALERLRNGDLKGVRKYKRMIDEEVLNYKETDAQELSEKLQRELDALIEDMQEFSQLPLKGQEGKIIKEVAKLSHQDERYKHAPLIRFTHPLFTVCKIKGYVAIAQRNGLTHMFRSAVMNSLTDIERRLQQEEWTDLVETMTAGYTVDKNDLKVISAISEIIKNPPVAEKSEIENAVSATRPIQTILFPQDFIDDLSLRLSGAGYSKRKANEITALLYTISWSIVVEKNTGELKFRDLDCLLFINKLERLLGYENKEILTAVLDLYFTQRLSGYAYRFSEDQLAILGDGDPKKARRKFIQLVIRYYKADLPTGFYALVETILKRKGGARKLYGEFMLSVQGIPELLGQNNLTLEELQRRLMGEVITNGTEGSV